MFNRLVGKRVAIVSDEANTTRDIVEAEVLFGDTVVRLGDSGGLVTGSNDEILKDVRIRTERAVEKADVLVLVLEYDRITDLDDAIIRMLRKSGKKVIIAANKADNPKRAEEVHDIMRTGIPFACISASHGRGMEELTTKILAMLGDLPPSEGTESIEEAAEIPTLAIIGRPNVGKSSIVNAILGEDRVMVRDMPGTTRDSIDTLTHFGEQPILLVDTAGIRRSGKIGIHNIESWSVIRSEAAIERADVVAVVMDADEGITHLDKAIISRALEAGKGIIPVMNKWDRYLDRPNMDKSKAMDNYMYKLRGELEFLAYATPIFTSATEGRRLYDILESTLGIFAERRKRIKTAAFNEFLSHATLTHAPTGNKKSHHPKIYYGSQVDVAPPKFVISVNRVEHFHFSYIRYLENRIREEFGFWGTPITVELRGRSKREERGKKQDDIEKTRFSTEHAEREIAPKKRAPRKKPDFKRSKKK